MRLISDVEAKLVAGGGFLASDSFDASGGGGGGMCWGSEFQDSCNIPSVRVPFPTIEDPNMANVWAAVGGLGATLIAIASAPVVATVGVLVVIGAAVGLATTK